VKTSDKGGQSTSLSYLHDFGLLDMVPLPGSCQASFGDIADSFDQLFQDFDEIVRLEAESLNRILSVRKAHTVLDCACGTGMQALGLAQLGYAVSASDISTKCLEILRVNAEKRGVTIDTKRADFRTLRPWLGTRFDAVIACGNSLPLVEQLEEIDQTLTSMRRVLKSGGCAIVSVRDYGILRDAQETELPRLFRLCNGNPEWVMDLRLFGAKRVRVVTVFIRAVAGRWRLRTFVKSYLYLSAEDLRKKMERAGFSRVQLLDLSALNAYTGGEWCLAVGEN